MTFKHLMVRGRLRCEAGARLGAALTLGFGAGACSSEAVNSGHEQAAQESAAELAAPRSRAMSPELRTKLDALVQRTHQEGIAAGRLGVPRVFELSPEGEVVREADTQADAPPTTTQLNASTLQSRFAGTAIAPMNGNPVLIDHNPLSGYQVGNQQAVTWCFGGEMNELSYPFVSNARWQYEDLTLQLSAPNCNGPSIAYGTSFDTRKEVLYVDTSRHLQRLYNDGSWHIDPDPMLASATTTGTALAGWQTSFNNQMHVAYVDTNQNVIELYHDSAWHTINVTAQAKAGPAANTALVAYQTTASQQEHVIYIDSSGQVNELYYQNGWLMNPILHVASPLAYTPPLGTVTALATTHITGYETTYNNQEHVVFVDSAGDLTELFFFLNGSWFRNDLIRAANATSQPPDPATPIAGYQTSYNSQEHVVYVSTNKHLIELFYQGGAWQMNDFNANPPPGFQLPEGVQISTYGLAGYQTLAPNQEHIDFATTDGHIQEFWYDTSWHYGPLTDLTSGITFTAVDGTWQVPTVSESIWPPGTIAGSTNKVWNSSSWIGLDGTLGNTNEILQTGVQQLVDSNGNPSFTPWYEWFVQNDTTPNYVFQTTYTNLVTPKAGDTMYGKVTLQTDSNGNVNGGTAMLWDKSITGSNNMMTVSLAPPPNASTMTATSAEWIFEAPGLDPTQTQIPQFTPVVFSEGLATNSQGTTVGPTDVVGTNFDITDFEAVGDQVKNVQLTQTSASNNRVTIDFCPGQNGCNQ